MHGSDCAVRSPKRFRRDPRKPSAEILGVGLQIHNATPGARDVASIGFFLAVEQGKLWSEGRVLSKDTVEKRIEPIASDGGASFVEERFRAGRFEIASAFDRRIEDRMECTRPRGAHPQGLIPPGCAGRQENERPEGFFDSAQVGIEPGCHRPSADRVLLAVGGNRGLFNQTTHQIHGAKSIEVGLQVGDKRDFTAPGKALMNRPAVMQDGGGRGREIFAGRLATKMMVENKGGACRPSSPSAKHWLPTSTAISFSYKTLRSVSSVGRAPAAGENTVPNPT